MRPHEDVVVDKHRLIAGDRRPAQHRVLADHRRLPDLDPRPLGIEHRTVHHPRPWPHADITDQRGRRGDVGGGMDLRFMPAVPDADSLRFSDHERILARPTASMLADFRRRVRRDMSHPRSEALQGERWRIRH